MPRRPPPRRRPGPPRLPRFGSRWRKRALLLAGVSLVALLYYRPVQAYLGTSDALARRAGEVRELDARKARLERRLTLIESGATLVRRARRLGLVRPGERLFIVKGIPEWRRARVAARAR